MNSPKTLVFILLVGSAFVCGCGASCPKAAATGGHDNKWEQALAAKVELRLEPRNPITIKRDVHYFDIAVDADLFARKFHEVMRDPNRRFGLIEVDRPATERGQSFHHIPPAGPDDSTCGKTSSRFQGRYRIEDTSPIWEKLSHYAPARDALCDFENENTSDYGVICALNLPPDPKPGEAHAHPKVGDHYEFEYHYLSGSPIAGSSRFEVAQIADNQCRLTQIFEYQEQHEVFAAFFANGGLTLHDNVLSSQVLQTAAALNVTILHTDLPAEYQIH